MFFEEIFLLANISIDVTLKIFFFTLSNIKINFNNQELSWRIYTIIEAILTIEKIELVKKKEFAIAVLNLENEIFVVYIALLTSLNLDMEIHLSCHTQIAL